MSAVLSPDVRTITFVRDELPRIDSVKYKFPEHTVYMQGTVATSCTCEGHWCGHTAMAQQLERDYQARLRMIPDHCSYCGRMCRSLFGQSTCPSCAGF